MSGTSQGISIDTGAGSDTIIIEYGGDKRGVKSLPGSDTFDGAMVPYLAGGVEPELTMGRPSKAPRTSQDSAVVPYDAEEVVRDPVDADYKPAISIRLRQRLAEMSRKNNLARAAAAYVDRRDNAMAVASEPPGIDESYELHDVSESSEDYDWDAGQRSFIDEDIDGVPSEPADTAEVVRDPIDADYVASVSQGQAAGSYDVERDPEDGDYIASTIGVREPTYDIERDPVDAEYIAPSDGATGPVGPIGPQGPFNWVLGAGNFGKGDSVTDWGQGMLDFAAPSSGLGVFVDETGIERDPVDAAYVNPVKTGGWR